MKLQNVVVPKHLIVDTQPHLEEYGESIVILKNGMWTDIYTRPNGEIFTPTNDDALIKYLRQERRKIKSNNKNEVSKGVVSLRKTTVEDADLLTRWNNDGQLMKRFGFPNGIVTTVDKMKAYILNGQTESSILNIIEINGQTVGELNYDIIDKKALPTMLLLDSRYLNMGYEAVLIKLIVYQLFEQQDIDKFVVDIHDKDKYEQQIYKKLGFVRGDQKPLKWFSYSKLPQKSIFLELSREDYEKCKGLFLD